MLQIPKKHAEAKIEIKNSRFIGRIFHLCTEEAALAKLNQVKSAFSDATHNCWAYRIEQNGQILYRFNDEGEPGGTAGKPILESLTEKNVVDALLVVTRYFGGIKLGMGGLSRAYRACAREVIEAAGLVEKITVLRLLIQFDYPHEAKLRNLSTRLGAAIINQDYTHKVKWLVEISEAKQDEFIGESKNICAGGILISEVEDIDER